MRLSLDAHNAAQPRGHISALGIAENRPPPRGLVQVDPVEKDARDEPCLCVLVIQHGRAGGRVGRGWRGCRGRRRAGQGPARRKHGRGRVQRRRRRGAAPTGDNCRARGTGRGCWGGPWGERRGEQSPAIVVVAVAGKRARRRGLVVVLFDVAGQGPDAAPDLCGP